MPGFEGYLVDEPGSGRWKSVIGALIINFGAVEYQSYAWIRRLSTDPSHLERALPAFFKPRTRIVEQLIREAHISESLESESLDAWNSARDLADFRNKIAHSPIAFVWRGRPADGEADFVKLIDYKSAAGELREDLTAIDFDEIDHKVNEVLALATRLQSLLDQLPSVNP